MFYIQAGNNIDKPMFQNDEFRMHRVRVRLACNITRPQSYRKLELFGTMGESPKQASGTLNSNPVTGGMN